MRNYILIILLFFIISCKNKKEILVENFKNIVQNELVKLNLDTTMNASISVQQDTVIIFLIDEESKFAMKNFQNLIHKHLIYSTKDEDVFNQFKYVKIQTQVYVEPYSIFDTTTLIIDENQFNDIKNYFDLNPKFHEFSSSLIFMFNYYYLVALETVLYSINNTSFFKYDGDFISFLYDYSLSCGKEKGEIYTLFRTYGAAFYLLKDLFPSQLNAINYYLKECGNNYIFISDIHPEMYSNEFLKAE